MSGHNKWSKIKRAKGAADAKRSKQWSNILKQVTIAVREGGPDPDSNPRLRLLVQNARGCNMPKDTLQRSINKANDKDAAQMQELTFECHVSHGIALFIEALSDNNNRTVANVKSIMNKYGGTLETNGSLAFLFTRKGVFMVPRKPDMESAVSTTTFLTNLSSFTSHTRGIMISGTTFQSACAFLTSIAARITALVCILAISG